MTATDAQITDLLHAGMSDRQIGIQLHTDPKRISRLRTGLGLPRAKSGVRPAASVEDLFRARTTPLPEAHLEWKGHVNNTGTPALRWQGRLLSAYRIAFRIRTGREPVGYAGPGCGMDQCVAPDHIDDQPARTRNRTAFDALFGGLA